MVNFASDFDGILPHPIFFLLIPFTVKFLLTYWTRLICEDTGWRWDRCIGLRSRFFHLRYLGCGDNGRIFVLIFDPFLNLVIYVKLKYLFCEIPGSGLATTYILTKLFVDPEVPVEVSVSFYPTFVCVGETASTCTTLEIIWIIQDVYKIRTRSKLV